MTKMLRDMNKSLEPFFIILKRTKRDFSLERKKLEDIRLREFGGKDFFIVQLGPI